jgi:hypothetical protein|tara:strand:+ start:397 stop:885 length:489 start_codon:yes stop_codon:yes gene_type:complete
VNGKRYNTGKINEGQSWAITQQRGYIKPTASQRKNIVDAFATIGKEVKPRGFDLIESAFADAACHPGALLEVIDQITLFELKTAGAKRKSEVKDDWSGLGFTLTSTEKHNAEILGDKFKFIFLNLKNHKMDICALGDFFKPEISNIYPTFSVFIKGGIASAK